MSELLLGIDIGTSSTKGVLARADGEVVAIAESISYELTPANVADVSLTEELLAEAKLASSTPRAPALRLRRRSRLPQRRTEGSLSRGGRPFGHRAIRAAMRGKAAHRDRLLELEAGVRSRRDVGYHAGGIGHRDRGQDLRLHLYAFLVNRLLDRPQGRIKELWA